MFSNVKLQWKCNSEVSANRSSSSSLFYLRFVLVIYGINWCIPQKCTQTVCDSQTGQRFLLERSHLVWRISLASSSIPDRQGERISLLYDAPEPNAEKSFFICILTDVASKCCWHFWQSVFPPCCILPYAFLFYKTFPLLFFLLTCTFVDIIFGVVLYHLFLCLCCIRSSPLSVSLRSVSVSLLVFFRKITRSGAVCVHVFCTGCIGWMLWLHWAGFLCGPPANFMIYSAKGRGARPPVTTERELHVGLMISPQKCLLWLGLHGAVLGEGDLADRPESIQMLTITLLLSGITRKGIDRQKSTFNWYVSNCCLTTNDGLCMRVVVLLSRILQAFSIPASPPHVL